MKKKHRCLLKRFAALVAALMLCASLCVPAFASNNASTKKWVVADERNLKNESGSMSRYLLLTPYVGGAQYAATFRTIGQTVLRSTDDLRDIWVSPVNYPDWWRSSIPLGAVSYLHISSLVVQSLSDSDGTTGPSLTGVYFYPLNSTYSLNCTVSYSSSALALQGVFSSYPVYYNYVSSSASAQFENTSFYIPVASSGTGTAYYNLSTVKQICFSSVFQADMPPSFAPSYEPGFSLLPTMYNLSSDQLIFAVAPCPLGYSLRSRDYSFDLSCSAVISFWIDANKLPAGLQVGDEFPADTDAFDQLRDDLIDQFPEAGDYIENGKDTIQGWNDTDTVDTDVASTSISVLNAMFQNLGSFLFIVSLMVFGAVVLRMLIRKAVDG